jgi:hypothetical protein
LPLPYLPFVASFVFDRLCSMLLLFRAARAAATTAKRPQALAALVLLVLASHLPSSAEAQTRNPYFQLQCSLGGAYCDRVYETAPPRHESFDELLARKERERALREQQQREREAQQQWHREQQRLARDETARQARLAREEERRRYRQMIADRIATAPALVRWFRAGWPVPQGILGGVILAFGTIAYIGRANFSTPPGAGFLAFGGISLLCLLLTYSAGESADPGLQLFLNLLPALAFLSFNGLHFLRGWHHLFVSHPATSVAGPPLRDEVLFPKQELAAALRPDPAQLFDHPPAYQSRDLTQKAEALRAKIDADAEIAAAAMRRDRARAAKMQADAELRAARKKLPWWRRWMWW